MKRGPHTHTYAVNVPYTLPNQFTPLSGCPDEIFCNIMIASVKLAPNAERYWNTLMAFSTQTPEVVFKKKCIPDMIKVTTDDTSSEKNLRCVAFRPVDGQLKMVISYGLLSLVRTCRRLAHFFAVLCIDREK